MAVYNWLAFNFTKRLIKLASFKRLVTVNQLNFDVRQQAAGSKGAATSRQNLG